MVDLERVADAVGRERVVHEDPHVVLINARWQDVIDALPQVDAVITDPPYSERTHGKQQHGRRGAGYSDSWVTSRGISYEHWSVNDAWAAARGWSRQCRGWLSVMSDHALQRAWEEALQSEGRYVFAPLPLFMPSMNVRLAGDGPSSWTVWLTVSRTKAQSKWGTLPGGYTGSPGRGPERAQAHIGGKPLWLMRALVSDYSREGDLILDPCAGGGTTGRAAKDLGRQAILVEMDGETCEKAARVLRPHRAWQQEFAL